MPWPYQQEVTMYKFIVERNIPNAGSLSPQELQAIARASNNVLQEMGVPYHWLESYVAGDKIYCIHVAPDEETVREHARRGGFPADSVTVIRAVIDPTTARA
jgi:hypothetical protein